MQLLKVQQRVTFTVVFPFLDIGASGDDFGDFAAFRSGSPPADNLSNDMFFTEFQSNTVISHQQVSMQAAGHCVNVLYCNSRYLWVAKSIDRLTDCWGTILNMALYWPGVTIGAQINVNPFTPIRCSIDI